LYGISFFDHPGIQFRSGAIVQTDENLKEIKKKQYETEKKLREKEKIQKELEQAGTGEEEPGGIVGDNTGFFLSEIIVQNAELLSEKEKQDLVIPFINREITFNDLTVLVRKITNLLIEKGYITARVKSRFNQNIK
jgi:hemolysin activation/secretion protein